MTASLPVEQLIQLMTDNQPLLEQLAAAQPGEGRKILAEAANKAGIQVNEADLVGFLRDKPCSDDKLTDEELEKVAGGAFYKGMFVPPPIGPSAFIYLNTPLCRYS